MTIYTSGKAKIDEFFEAIAPLRSAYSEPSFTYLAVREREGFVLTKGRISFNTAPSKIPLTHFQSANVRAGHYSLAELGMSPEKLLEAAGTGKIATPAGALRFPPDSAGAHTAHYQPFHQEGLQNQNRIDVLNLIGALNTAIQRTVHLDWEVRAFTTPYDGLQELINEYSIGAPRNDNISMEVVAYNVAVFDTGSVIDGTKAQIGVRIAKEAKQGPLKLGFRVLSQGKVLSRGSISGTDFKWAEDTDFQKGTAELEVPEAAVLHCVASYAGVAEHQGWAIDPNTVQNPLRAAYETFDSKLDFLREVIAREGKEIRSRDLEAAVGWLLWMHGFSVANLGGTDRTQDAADLLVTTPAGNIGVIEVTTGLLKANHKLSNLHERAQAVRRSLEKSNNRHVRILPIIVTSKSRAEVEPDIEQAERWGILVLAREALNELVNATLVMPKAEQLFEQAEKTVREARAKYDVTREVEPTLPLRGGS